MSGKSQHRRGKHAIHGKRKKGKLRPQVIAAQPQAVTQADESVSPEVPVPSTRTATTAAPLAVKYPYILTELRRIGILAGIMIAILIVLALVYA